VAATQTRRSPRVLHDATIIISIRRPIPHAEKRSGRRTRPVASVGHVPTLAHLRSAGPNNRTRLNHHPTLSGLARIATQCALQRTRAYATPEVILKFPTIAILAVAASLFATSLSNADAASRSRHGRGAYAAAQSIPSTMERNAARPSVMHECCSIYSHMTEQIWGVQGTEGYRACMAAHGQME
jgi:hypothetical protein